MQVQVWVWVRVRVRIREPVESVEVQRVLEIGRHGEDGNLR